MNLLNVAIVTTYDTHFQASQAYRNRYNIIDHGHKKNYFYVFFQRRIKSMEDFGESILNLS